MTNASTIKGRTDLSYRRAVLIFREALAWAWFVVAGGGGFGLILTEGALPLTHGWYAMFSGIAWCPATAWLLRRYAHLELSYWIRFAIAASLILLGRIALIVRIWPFG
jgi:hypothetical protein